MKKTLLVAALGLIGTLCVLDPAAARDAGSTTVGVEIVKFDSLAPGWSVKRSILGRTVYNDAGEKVGRIDDLIIDPEKGVSHLIVGVGGFIGMGRHKVAIATTSLREQGARIVLTGASKAQITAMPRFDYAINTERRDHFVASAVKDIDRAKATIVRLERTTATASGTAKEKIDREIAGLQQDRKDVEEQLDAMSVASAARWKDFEAQVMKATARLRRSIHRSSV